MFPVESVALINTLARTTAGHRVLASSISLTDFLNKDTLNKIAISASEKLWDGFLQFGTASAGVIGVWIILKLVKMIIQQYMVMHCIQHMAGLHLRKQSFPQLLTSCCICQNISSKNMFHLKLQHLRARRFNGLYNFELTSCHCLTDYHIKRACFN
jgi:hypothetical protein